MHSRSLTPEDRDLISRFIDSLVGEVSIGAISTEEAVAKIARMIAAAAPADGGAWHNYVRSALNSDQ